MSGPLVVEGGLVETEIHVDKGDLVVTMSKGKISFFLGAWYRDADGEDKDANNRHPAPDLRRNSLICKIDDTWYQGGVFRGFESKTSGFLYLQTNDDFIYDNTDQWRVKVAVIRNIKSYLGKEKYNEVLNHIYNFGSSELAEEYNNVSEELLKTEKVKVFQKGLQDTVREIGS